MTMDSISSTDSTDAPAPSGPPGMPLDYASPRTRTKTPLSGTGVIIGVAVIVLAVCFASLVLFMIVVHDRQDLWAAAASIGFLSAMGVLCTLFLTRRM
jgi:hypothetical protein